MWKRAALWGALIIWLAPLAVARAETVSLPGGAAGGVQQDDPIYQVSCPAAGDCVGVGAYVDTSGNNQALIESEAGGVWSPGNVPDASLPDAGVAPQPYLASVSCASVGNCVAADAYDDVHLNEQGLIDTLSGGLWTPIAAPLAGLSVFTSQPPGPGAELYEVNCPSAGGCVAVGTYTGSDTYAHGLIETQSGAGWTPLQAPAPPNPNANSQPTFQGISCASVGNCAAVGYYTDAGGHQQGWLETDRSGSWSAARLDLSQLSAGAAPPATDPQATLYGVSCPAAGNCTAVGTYQDAAGSYEGLVVSEVGGAWQPATEATLPADASTQTVGSNPAQYDLYLNGVSCASAGNCTAVGSYDAGQANDVEGLTLTETGDVWAPGVPVSLPPGRAADPHALLDSVTCQAPADCVAVGTYVESGGKNAALVARQTPSGWSTAGAELTDAYDPSVSLDYYASVSCSADGYCATGGYAADNAAGLKQAFLLDAPAAPSALTASLSAGQSGGAPAATVTWSAPTDNGGLPLTGYTVTADDLTAAGRSGPAVGVSAQANEAVLTGLVSGDTYRFTVTATSLLGTGLSATSASVTVPGGASQTTITTTSTTPTGPTTTHTITETGSGTPTGPGTATAPGTADALETTSAGVPSRPALRASLAALLHTSGRDARASLRRGTERYRLNYRALERGRVSVGWYLASGHGRARHRSLIASGSLDLGGPGAVTIVVRLTQAGRRRLGSGHRTRLTAVASFADAGLTVERASQITLG